MSCIADLGRRAAADGRDISQIIGDLRIAVAELQLEDWVTDQYPPRGFIWMFCTHPHINRIRAHPMVRDHAYSYSEVKMGLMSTKYILCDGLRKNQHEQEWGQYVDIETGDHVKELFDNPRG